MSQHSSPSNPPERSAHVPEPISHGGLAEYQDVILRLAIFAHADLKPGDADFAYQAGYRDACARAYAILQVGPAACAAPASAALANGVIRVIERGTTNPDEIRQTVEGVSLPYEQGRADVLTWINERTFARISARHSGIDEDLGLRWGPRRDIRISMRAPSEGGPVLLYGYDPTWNEYAVLDVAADPRSARAAFSLAVAIDPQMSPARFVHLYEHERGPVTPTAEPDGMGISR